MPRRLSEDISGYGSIAVVGLAKNVGKTVTLNHLLGEAHRRHITTGVTSIGVDGENTDIVTRTQKPEIKIYHGMLFATSETHYRIRRLEAEILNLGTRQTSMGRIVTAKALTDGKAMLSGPAETSGISALINEMHSFGAETVFVDGALSRLSPASPAVTDAMVLATGAAVSPEISRIVNKTAFTCRLIDLEEVDEELQRKLTLLKTGVWTIDSEGTPHDLGVESALDIEKIKDSLFRYGTTIYISGMVGDRLLKYLTAQKNKGRICLIVKDFTRLFVDPAVLNDFCKNGEIKVLKKSKLIGVTINPWSPQGFTVDKEKLLEKMAAKLPVPVYNIASGESSSI